jgi:transposase
MARRSNTPNPENCSLTELETAAKCSPSRQAYARMTAIAALLQGHKPEMVASIFFVERRTLQRWVARFNEAGIDGLINKPRAGRPRKISPEQSLQYERLIENPDKANETHWTARKFHGYLRQELNQEIGYRSVVRWLSEKGFRLKVPQPWPDRQDEELRQAYLVRLGEWLDDERIDLWYLDETGIEGDPRPRRRWARKGSKPRVTKNGGHLRMNVTGMVCPRTGAFYALEFSHSDSEIFQIFLDHANADLKLKRRRNLLIMDNASWHKRASTHWGDFEPVYLPPYSPDFNPIERLWLLLKAEWFSDYISKTREQLCERLDKALCWIIQRKEKNKKTCAIQK